jgi:hypothetical protein
MRRRWISWAIGTARARAIRCERSRGIAILRGDNNPVLVRGRSEQVEAGAVARALDPFADFVMLAAPRADWRENDLADVKQAEFHCRCSFQSGMTSQTTGSGPIAVRSMPMARRGFLI